MFTGSTNRRMLLIVVIVSVLAITCVTLLLVFLLPARPKGKVVCDELACATNAICSIVDSRISCSCNPGFTGDPYKGECMPVAMTKACQYNSTYKTFDSMYFVYEGTCPYVLSEPCSSNHSHLPPYSIHATNQIIAELK